MPEVIHYPAIYPFEEKIDFLTSTLSAKAGEFSYEIREFPRWSFTYSYSTLRNAQSFRALAERIGNKLCKIPAWFSYCVALNLTMGQTTVTTVVDYLWLPVDSKEILILSPDSNGWELNTVISKVGDLITLKTPLLQNYDKVYIIPVVSGSLEDGIVFSESSSAKLTFKTDYFNSYAEPFQMLNSIPICPFRYELTSLEHRITRKSSIFDTYTGITEVLDIETYDRLAQTGTISVTTHADINRLRNFLTTLKGKFQPFYLSMGLAEFKPKQKNLTVGATTLDVEYSSRLSKTRLLNLKNTTSNLYVEITALTMLSETTSRLHLTNPMPADFLDIRGIEFMQLVRLESDSLVITHVSKRLAKASFPVSTFQRTGVPTYTEIPAGSTPIPSGTTLYFLMHLDSSVQNLGNAGGTPSLYPQNTNPVYTNAVFGQGLAVRSYQLVCWQLGAFLNSTSSYTLRFRAKVSQMDTCIMGDTSASEYIRVNAEGYLTLPSIGIATTAQVVLNTFHAFSIEQTASGFYLYLNGQRIYSGASLTFLGVSPDIIFWRGYGSGSDQDVIVTVDEVVAFNVALTGGALSYIPEALPYANP